MMDREAVAAQIFNTLLARRDFTPTFQTGYESLILAFSYADVIVAMPGKSIDELQVMAKLLFPDPPPRGEVSSPSMPVVFDTTANTMWINTVNGPLGYGGPQTA